MEHSIDNHVLFIHAVIQGAGETPEQHPSDFTMYFPIQGGSFLYMMYRRVEHSEIVLAKPRRPGFIPVIGVYKIIFDFGYKTNGTAHFFRAILP